MKFKKVKNIPNTKLPWKIRLLWLTPSGWVADAAHFPDTFSARFHAKLCNRTDMKQIGTASDFCIGYVPDCTPKIFLLTFPGSDPSLRSIPVSEIKGPL